MNYFCTLCFKPQILRACPLSQLIYLCLNHLKTVPILQSLKHWNTMKHHCFTACNTVKMATSAGQLLVLHLCGYIQFETMVKQFASWSFCSVKVYVLKIDHSSTACSSDIKYCIILRSWMAEFHIAAWLSGSWYYTRWLTRTQPLTLIMLFITLVLFHLWQVTTFLWKRPCVSNSSRSHNQGVIMNCFTLLLFIINVAAQEKVNETKYHFVQCWWLYCLLKKSYCKGIDIVVMISP